MMSPFEILLSFSSSSSVSHALWVHYNSQGLAQLQRMGLCHRALSPQSILVDEERNSITIIDLDRCLRVPYDPNGGEVTDVSAKTLRRLIAPQSWCGAWLACPDILPNNDAPFDGFAIDLWAAASILFIMLTDYLPWKSAREEDPCYSFIMSQGLQKLLKGWELEISPDATNLLQKMLQEDPRNRLTLAEVQHHPWVVRDADALADEGRHPSVTESHVGS